MYIEASSPRSENDIAELVTPVFQRGSYCVRFAYSMYGDRMGSLKVFTLGLKSTTPQLRWEQSGNQGIDWHQATIQIFGSEAVKFIFQGQIGGGYSGDAAIDDINIQPGSCSGRTTLAPPTTTKTTTTTTTTTITSTTTPKTTTKPLTAGALGKQIFS